jgi:hypothetical protein
MVDIEKIERRAVRSFYDDGLFEIAFGLIFLILGGYFFAQTAVPADSFLKAALSALFFLVVYALFGLSLIVSGLTALVVYLRRSPRPEPEGPEGPDAR